MRFRLEFHWQKKSRSIELASQVFHKKLLEKIQATLLETTRRYWLMESGSEDCVSSSLLWI